MRFYENCEDWKWGQCSVRGKYLILITGISLLFLTAVSIWGTVHCIRRRKGMCKEEAKFSAFEGGSMDREELSFLARSESAENIAAQWDDSGTVSKKSKKSKRVSWGPTITVRIN